MTITFKGEDDCNNNNIKLVNIHSWLNLSKKKIENDIKRKTKSRNNEEIQDYVRTEVFSLVLDFILLSQECAHQMVDCKL